MISSIEVETPPGVFVTQEAWSLDDAHDGGVSRDTPGCGGDEERHDTERDAKQAQPPYRTRSSVLDATGARPSLFIGRPHPFHHALAEYTEPLDGRLPSA